MKKTVRNISKDHNMEAQQVWHLSFVSTWIFVFFFLSVCSGMSTLELESTVFVAFAGEEIAIKCELVIPANQTRYVLTCSDPFENQIYNYSSETTGQRQRVQLTLKLKNLAMSGEYSCQYKKATVYWFLRVRGDGYRDLVMWDYTEFIIVAVFTGVLLVFSVVGSVCVFRGHGKCTTECRNTDRKRKQNTEEMKETEMEEDNMDVITAPSTSFYASLEPRPRSIYDVLDHSAANREPDQSKAKPKKREPKETMTQPTQDQHEGVFEIVYENF
ncbi:uncharacterized protein si:ch211-243a20.4 isoform X2 [Perca fluviatilis]|uniref:uncharacterized protein si:ch211-243a20.4 isoform X2 n=1 Tax=Perca fluviatilis TaxID=8168 RepID=UPI001965BD8F|nr:uncharacterized protein si:ch211-243a20.4 isoform X2 [Perca fluviatilis]